MIRNRLFVIFFLLGFAGCSEDRLYEDFQSIASEGWSIQDSLIFQIGELPEAKGSSLVAVRFREEYPYSNFYVRIVSRDSLHQVLSNRLINLALFDKDGEPIGDGFGSTYTRYDTLPFALESTAREIILLQYMREENLQGIEAVGIKILKK